MLHGYKRLRDVWADKSLSSLVVREVFPGSDVTSDEDLWRAIQNSATTFHHPVSALTHIKGRFKPSITCSHLSVLLNTIPRLAQFLLDAFWRAGRFELEDLMVSVS